jgi:LmbE family N-acetylglucosaminyl deacetylase
MDITSFRKVLVLAPHTDDGELGAGGSIVKLIDAGAEVFYAGILCSLLNCRAIGAGRFS